MSVSASAQDAFVPERLFDDGLGECLPPGARRLMFAQRQSVN
jgi:hypothetical protein